MASTTQAAAVLSALVATWREALSEEIVVKDGQPLTTDDPDLLVVGFSATGPSVEIAQADDDLAGGRIERMTVSCLSSAQRGENDDEGMAEVRTRAVEILDLAIAALEDDPSLGGVVSRAEFGMPSALDQAQVKRGVAASIEFVVLVEVL